MLPHISFVHTDYSAAHTSTAEMFSSCVLVALTCRCRQLCRSLVAYWSFECATVWLPFFSLYQKNVEVAALLVNKKKWTHTDPTVKTGKNLLNLKGSKSSLDRHTVWSIKPLLEGNKRLHPRYDDDVDDDGASSVCVLPKRILCVCESDCCALFFTFARATVNWNKVRHDLLWSERIPDWAARTKNDFSHLVALSIQ